MPAGYLGIGRLGLENRTSLEKRAKGVGQVKQIIGENIRLELGSGQFKHFRQSEQSDRQSTFGRVGQCDGWPLARIVSGEKFPLRKMLWIRA